MKEISEKFLEKKVDHAVITCPAYFNDTERHMIKNSGLISGLNVERIIYEPMAAAVAYGFQDNYNERNILVYRLGKNLQEISLIK